jgi:hypothetical protein
MVQLVRGRCKIVLVPLTRRKSSHAIQRLAMTGPIDPSHVSGSSIMTLSRRSLLAGVAALPILATGCVKTRWPDSTENALFFERTRRRSARKVFPHYFGQLPRSLDNSPTPDYYDREYLRVAGESGKHAAYGGYLRDRPLPRTPIAGDYEFEDATWDIRTAQAMGADGFFVNITGLEGSTWNRYQKLLAAAEASDGEFFLIPMIDTTGGNMASRTPPEIASALASFIGRPSSYEEEGKFVLAGFNAKGFSVQRWQDIIAVLGSLIGAPVCFIGILVNPSRETIATYASISDYLGNWIIGADPAMLAATENTAGRAPGLAREAGCKWVGTSHTQIVVPYAQHYFDEAANSGALRQSWWKIIEQSADHVQCVTWCDFSEGGQLTPSVARGWSSIAITAYYLERYKFGRFPRITRDVLFLSHRNEPLLGVSYQSGQTEFMTQTERSYMTPVQDRVEALTYLTAPADVTVSVGGVLHEYRAPAGESVRTFPNALGSVSGTFARNGSVLGEVTSPFPVTARPVSQDRQYFFVSTLHGTEDQRHNLIHL